MTNLELADQIEALAKAATAETARKVTLLMLDNADTLVAALREVERLREALERIAMNDEYPLDTNGDPMPIRPQWSREQCSSIARAALKDQDHD